MGLRLASTEAISQPTPNVYRIPIRVNAPSQYIYAHAIFRPQGWVIVDLGRNDSLAQASWRAAEDRLGLGRGTVAFVILTHYHADHVGLAAWASKRWQTPIRMLPGEQAMVYRLYRTPRETLGLESFYHHMGVPSGEIAPLIATYLEEAAEVCLPSRMETLIPGERIAAGDREFHVLSQGGHTEEHAVLYEPKGRLVISGDQILPRITPNIGYLPGGDPNPLASYFAALAEIQALSIRLCLPSHESVIAPVNPRIQEIVDHHQHRLAVLLARLGTGATAYEMAHRIFTGSLSPFQWRFALGEIVAHMEYLREQDQIRSAPIDDEGTIRYLP